MTTDPLTSLLVLAMILKLIQLESGLGWLALATTMKIKSGSINVVLL